MTEGALPAYGAFNCFFNLEERCPAVKGSTLHKQKCSGFLGFGPVLVRKEQESCGAYACRRGSNLELLKGLQQLSLDAFLHL